MKLKALILISLTAYGFLFSQKNLMEDINMTWIDGSFKEKVALRCVGCSGRSGLPQPVTSAIRV